MAILPALSPALFSPGLPVLIFACLVLAGCATTLAPRYQQPVPPIAPAWPDPLRYDVQGSAGIAWEDLFLDPGLRATVQMALENNRDLRIATLNIEKARALYGMRRSALLPTVGAGVTGNSGRTPESVSPTGVEFVSHTYAATLGVSAWELDLLGRLRSLKDQALQQYLATDAAQRAVGIGLIAEVGNGYLGLAASKEQLALARDTLRGREDALDLQRALREAGSASDLVLRQAEAELEVARDRVLALESAAAISRNALELLVGTPLPPELHPRSALDAMLVAGEIPAGLPSDLLRNRPDILAAEHSLIAANADIGTARAAFFPRIQLTGGIGRASASLSSLFDGGNRSWNFVPQIDVPIFDFGHRRANLDVAKVTRDIAVSDYERAIQTAFREVADALAVRATLDGRLEAQQRQVDAASAALSLARARYQNGVSSHLEVLDTQRTLYAAQQGLIAIRLSYQSNQIALYKALGGSPHTGASPLARTSSAWNHSSPNTAQ